MAKAASWSEWRHSGVQMQKSGCLGVVVEWKWWLSENGGWVKIICQVLVLMLGCSIAQAYNDVVECWTFPSYFLVFSTLFWVVSCDCRHHNRIAMREGRPYSKSPATRADVNYDLLLHSTVCLPQSHNIDPANVNHHNFIFVLFVFDIKA